VTAAINLYAHTVQYGIQFGCGAVQSSPVHSWQGDIASIPQRSPCDTTSRHQQAGPSPASTTVVPPLSSHHPTHPTHSVTHDIYTAMHQLEAPLDSSTNRTRRCSTATPAPSSSARSTLPPAPCSTGTGAQRGKKKKKKSSRPKTWAGPQASGLSDPASVAAAAALSLLLVPSILHLDLRNCVSAARIPPSSFYTGSSKIYIYIYKKSSQQPTLGY
jgi:hypothetical protein